jgi:hypothetical protein
VAIRLEPFSDDLPERADHVLVRPTLDERAAR